ALMMSFVALGCGFVDFEDVSDIPEFSDLMGREFVSMRETHLYGVSLDRDYAPHVDKFEILPVSIAGPEVVSSETLPPGTKITVVSVLRCTNCWLDLEERIEVEVKFDPPRLQEEAKVRINLEHLRGDEAAFQAVKLELR
ncbi:MAG: hypothetical protein IPK00_25510, partial [Deltaproteobacteria bacterium]|nr:hypothetical protein [Deltaproteobacteria bacterium]